MDNAPAVEVKHLRQPLDAAGNTVPLVSRLRNQLRILNHLPLVQEKLSVAAAWGLKPALDGRPSPASPLLQALADRKVDSRTALKELVRSVGRSGQESDAEHALLSTYKTGLVEFHITDVCDLDCVECHYRNKAEATVPYSKLAESVRRLSPKAITITGGGEPNVYRSEGQGLNEAIVEIHRAAPLAGLGLINNNSHIPKGDWTKHILWQRTSVDAATAETYRGLKRRDVFPTVVENVIRLLHETEIPAVGVGFLFRRENVAELSLFLNNWFDYIAAQPGSIQRRFNIQFRPISPGIDQVEDIRGGRLYPDGPTLRTLESELSKVRLRLSKDPAFEAFIKGHTNFESSFGPEGRPCDNSLFVHRPTAFNSCYNALCHRVFRSTGEEYPDFLLCNSPELSLGNVLHDTTNSEALRVAMMQFYYLNRLGPFCRSETCRQGWVSMMVERGHPASATVPDPAQDPFAYFF